jgi:hypothetical protein
VKEQKYVTVSGAYQQSGILSTGLREYVERKKRSGQQRCLGKTTTARIKGLDHQRSWKAFKQ